MEETGLEILAAETGRQHTDALAAFHAQQGRAEDIAGDIRRIGRLDLLGVGGSHWVNRMAEPAYRRLGIAATAHNVSEYMRAPLPGAAVRIATSQSGGSGEILAWLDGAPGGPVYGLTMARDGPLAARVPCLVAEGPPERSYAATRSVMVTLAQHAAILTALGGDMEEVERALAAPGPMPDGARAIDALAAARSHVFSARGAMQGLAGSAALLFMELSRRPVLALEAAQFRHGPFEAADRDTCVLFFRGIGQEGDNIDGLARALLDEDIRPVIIDASGEAPVDGAITVPVTPAHGLAAILRSLPVVQNLAIGATSRMVPDFGRPLRSTKVTSSEAE
ncbi:hypothetical protein OCH239_16970 [Roseivivax halodurans JCM 10272]|uniref:SIS domain-containing protein n=1 Tax=Roseivivax halodurans JCM 10272 TaxID=1449350 RepID=X7E9R3_9RHOB|nr:SIS domain-containing protein [Roseivivax halodurans]ETX12824.1 hypothetical protein OCH239_16970 [Roseivivax halodurans JCM 10272]